MTSGRGNNAAATTASASSVSDKSETVEARPDGCNSVYIDICICGMLLRKVHRLAHTSTGRHIHLHSYTRCMCLCPCTKVNPMRFVLCTMYYVLWVLRTVCTVHCVLRTITNVKAGYTYCGRKSRPDQSSGLIRDASEVTGSGPVLLHHSGRDYACLERKENTFPQNGHTQGIHTDAHLSVTGVTDPCPFCISAKALHS